MDCNQHCEFRIININDCTSCLIYVDIWCLPKAHSRWWATSCVIDPLGLQIVQDAFYISTSYPNANFCWRLCWKWESCPPSPCQPWGPQPPQGLDWATHDTAPKPQDGFPAYRPLRGDRWLDFHSESWGTKIWIYSDWYNPGRDISERFRGEIGDRLLPRERASQRRLSRPETDDRFGT